MTGEEAKKALMERFPVVSNGIEYKRLSAIIYRVNEHNKIKVYAELTDKNEHSVTITPIEMVSAANETE